MTTDFTASGKVTVTFLLVLEWNNTKTKKWLADFSLRIQWEVLTEIIIGDGINYLPMHYFVFPMHYYIFMHSGCKGHRLHGF